MSLTSSFLVQESHRATTISWALQQCMGKHHVSLHNDMHTAQSSYPGVTAAGHPALQLWCCHKVTCLDLDVPYVNFALGRVLSHLPVTI
jgi:hypothetical protein